MVLIGRSTLQVFAYRPTAKAHHAFLKCTVYGICTFSTREVQGVTRGGGDMPAAHTGTIAALVL
jgi:hypothetical protein